MKRRSNQLRSKKSQLRRPSLAFKCLDVNATLVGSHSDKEHARGNYKGGYGFHPMLCYLDGSDGALDGILRPGNAGSNTGSDQTQAVEFALQQLPEGCMEEEILVRYLPGREARHGAPATALSFGDHGLTSRREDTVLAARCKDPRSVEASGDAPCLEIVSASPHRACPRCEHHASSPGCCRPSCRYCSYAGVGARWIQVPARKGCAGVSLGAFRRRMPRRFMSSSAAVRGSYP